MYIGVAGTIPVSIPQRQQREPVDYNGELTATQKITAGAGGEVEPIR
jgi:hypothetical protein